MTLSTGGVVSGDFTQILNDEGRTVRYQVVTITHDPITGSEVTSFATAANQTAIFFLEKNRFIWDKEGLLSVGDAYIIVPTTLGAKRYDQVTVDSQSYYIDNVTRRTILQTDMCDYCVLFKVA